MSEVRKRLLLERALEDKELLATVPAVVALSFGVVPVRKLGGVLTVACFPRANRDALRLLREVLSLEVIAVPVEDRPLQTALQKAYHGEEDRSPNFPTFATPDFLAQPGAAAILGREKVEPLGRTGSSLAAGRVLLATWTYRSCLWNLDLPGAGGALPDPRATKYELRDQELVWTRDRDGSPVAWRPRGAPALDPDAVLLANEFRLSDHRHVAPGTLFAEHRVLGTTLGAPKLPYVIHPTEVQLARVDAPGALVFHVYDHEERIDAGAPRGFRCDYHFLSFGSRLRREIQVEVHELILAERAGLAVRAGKAPWSPRELERWFAAPPTRPFLERSAP